MVSKPALGVVSPAWHADPVLAAPLVEGEGHALHGEVIALAGAGREDELVPRAAEQRGHLYAGTVDGIGRWKSVPIDFGWVREQLGPDVEIKGGPSVSLLATAPPRQVYEEVRRIVTSGVTEGGRFVLREGNNLPPDVPLTNLQAMYAAVRDFGHYC